LVGKNYGALDRKARACTDVSEKHVPDEQFRIEVPSRLREKIENSNDTHRNPCFINVRRLAKSQNRRTRSNDRPCRSARRAHRTSYSTQPTGRAVGDARSYARRHTGAAAKRGAYRDLTLNAIDAGDISAAYRISHRYLRVVLRLSAIPPGTKATCRGGNDEENSTRRGGIDDVRPTRLEDNDEG